MNAPQLTPLPADVALELAYAMIQRTADSAEINVLFLKGLAAEHHRLRRTRVSTDVDVWLRRSDLGFLDSRLAARGWYRRPESFAHARFVLLSYTYMHDQWPCDIDVHIAFPGLFADDAFDVLLDHAVAIEVGGIPVAIPDRPASFVIGAAHALRQAYLPSSAAELSYLTDVWRNEFDERERDEVRALANGLGAVESLRPLFASIGMEVPSQSGYSRELADWRIATRQLNRTSRWLELIAQHPPAQRVKILARAVFPSRADLVRDHPDADSGGIALLRTRLRRIASATRALPDAWRTWREYRRELERSAILDPTGMQPSAVLEATEQDREGAVRDRFAAARASGGSASAVGASSSSMSGRPLRNPRGRSETSKPSANKRCEMRYRSPSASTDAGERGRRCASAV